jgi:hypothetical protein
MDLDHKGQGTRNSQYTMPVEVKQGPQDLEMSLLSSRSL